MLQMVKPEQYTIEITGLKDTYLLEESYSFSYILSGFGSPCGGIHAIFPINKTTNGNDGFISGCLKTIPTTFVLDANKVYGRTYGNIALHETGNYTVKISFEKPLDAGTKAEKNFTVINP